jgi:hypothetical protein
MRKKAEIYNDFEGECRRWFDFLETDFLFRIISLNKNDVEANITYANETTAIDVRYELKDNLVFVYLIRLIDGKIPDFPLTIKTDTELYKFDLDSLIHLRSASLAVDQKQFGYPFSQKDFEVILSRYSKALQKIGSDILKGDFTVFSELERSLKRWLASSG